MSILSYLQESLSMNESQKEAKQLAQSGKTSFDMDAFTELKQSLPSPSLYKYMGWIARNWDYFSTINNIGELVDIYDSNVGRSNNNLEPINTYKKDPERWVSDIQTTQKSIKSNDDEDNTPSSERVNILWESEDGSIIVGVPQTKSASVKQGQGSRWCTAANTSKGVDYDAQHMFCVYVLDRKGLMIYIINNNLDKDDKFHKTAIRVTESENNPGTVYINEIRAMDNLDNYKGNNGFGWNDEYDEYLKKYDIPLESILNNIQPEIDNLDDERDKFKVEKKFISHIIDDDIEGMKEMIDDGYVPHSSALNNAVRYNKEDIIKFLSKFKTVKMDDLTLAHAFIGGHPNMIENVIDWGANWKNIPLNKVTVTGNEEWIRKALENNPTTSGHELDYLINKTNNPDLLKMALDIGIMPDDDDPIYSAMRVKNPEILSMLLSTDFYSDIYNINLDLLQEAIDSKNTEIVNIVFDYMDKHDLSIPKHYVKRSNRYNNDEVSDLLISAYKKENDIDDDDGVFNKYDIIEALMMGNIEDLKFIYDNKQNETEIPLRELSNSILSTNYNNLEDEESAEYVTQLLDLFDLDELPYPLILSTKEVYDVVKDRYPDADVKYDEDYEETELPRKDPRPVRKILRAE